MITTPQKLDKILSNIFIFIISSFIFIIIIDKTSILFVKPGNSEVEKTYSLSEIRSLTPYIGFKGAPYAKAWKLHSQREGITDHILNELGYPGNAPSMPKPPNEYRIIVLGGSAAFMGNPAIPGLIQYYFEDKNCFNVKVYNFSVVSSVTSMELARLVFEVINYKPDLVISYSGFNDIDEPYVADPRPGYPFNHFIFESNPLLDSDVQKYPLLPLVAYSSNLLRHFFPSYFLKTFTNIDNLRATAGHNTDLWRESIAETYVNNMIKSQLISKSFGAEYIAILQPSLYFKDFINKRELPHISKKRMENSIKIRKIILNKIKQVEKNNNLRFINLSDFFDNKKDLVFKDRVHIWHHFRPSIANNISQSITTLLKETKPKNISTKYCE